MTKWQYFCDMFTFQIFMQCILSIFFGDSSLLPVVALVGIVSALLTAFHEETPKKN
jgi:hypothetical protein